MITNKTFCEKAKESYLAQQKRIENRVIKNILEIFPEAQYKGNRIYELCGYEFEENFGKLVYYFYKKDFCYYETIWDKEDLGRFLIKQEAQELRRQNHWWNKLINKFKK